MVGLKQPPQKAKNGWISYHFGLNEDPKAQEDPNKKVDYGGCVNAGAKLFQQKSSNRMIWKSMKIFWQPWGCRGCPHQKNCVCLLLFDQKRPKAVVRPWLMLQKIYFMVFERYIPELKKYDTILFLHLKIIQRHMAYPVHCITLYFA